MSENQEQYLVHTNTHSCMQTYTRTQTYTHICTHPLYSLHTLIDTYCPLHLHANTHTIVHSHTRGRTLLCKRMHAHVHTRKHILYTHCTRQRTHINFQQHLHTNTRRHARTYQHTHALRTQNSRFSPHSQTAELCHTLFTVWGFVNSVSCRHAFVCVALRAHGERAQEVRGCCLSVKPWGDGLISDSLWLPSGSTCSRLRQN